MHLKRLELNGFKSFAKQTVFEFPSHITAIVGPNGAGKSNCAEAIRWVLGEQSMKSLRGKKGEDLIFNGSLFSSRMSKASVTLVFDNSKHQFPIEFREVALGRHVYRDGVNDYMINGSQTRLKDIIELLAHVGLGSSQHHIIGQGEADRILYASPKERKEMVEDALGLKIYQIKRMEAERKLERTRENMRQVEALQKEIQPHLKFLKTQAAKFEKTEELRKNLQELYSTYFSREEGHLDLAEKDVASKKDAPLKEVENFEKKRKQIEELIAKEKQMASVGDETAFEGISKELSRLRLHKSEFLRELGKIEGMMEIDHKDSEKRKGDETISRESVEELCAEIDTLLSSALEAEETDSIHSLIHEALSRLASFVEGLDAFIKGEKSDKKTENFQNLLERKKKIDEALEDIQEKENSLLMKEKKLGGSLHAYEKKLRELEGELYGLNSSLNRVKDILRILSAEEERISLRKEELEREKEEARHYIDIGTVTREFSSFSDAEREQMRKDITRLKFKLEDAGGVDESIIKELKDVSERDTFFGKELYDLEKASSDLKKLSYELGEKLEKEFEKGISKINIEFQIFFDSIFGGGKAELRLVNIETEKEKDEEEEEKENKRVEESCERGIDVSVTLPRKRIRGLDMLSGGERALTSIALLFALSSVNPPPFLVLDEIDAALDENNSRRYGAMLRDLSKETQLVLITHNRESMRNADVLYGVTMGSDGISKILSLKLEEAVEYSK